MFVFNIILGLCLFLALLYTLRRGRTLKRIGAELEIILQNLRNMAAKSAPSGQNVKKSFDDPGMLSTLLTVVVNKYGTLSLNIEDFAALADEDYVSVYVDGNEQNLILSLDHNLASVDSTKFINFGKADDTTFH